MTIYNKISRHDIAEQAIRGILKSGQQTPISSDAHLLISGYQHKIREIVKYANETGEDPPEFKTAVLHEA
jgi:xylulose-5-phosphate/fructose-6-phosphate phosphoketolase